MIRIALSGVSGAPYSSYEYDYVGGVFAGSQFNYTTVPRARPTRPMRSTTIRRTRLPATSSSSPIFPASATPTRRRISTPAAKLSRVLLTGVTGQSYYQLEEDYNAGDYEGYKAYYQIAGEPYTTEEVDVSNSNQLEKVVYSGMTSTPVFVGRRGLRQRFADANRSTATPT